MHVSSQTNSSQYSMHCLTSLRWAKQSSFTVIVILTVHISRLTSMITMSSNGSTQILKCSRIASLTANSPLGEIGYLLHFNMRVEPFGDSVIIEVSLLMWTVKITIAVNDTEWRVCGERRAKQSSFTARKF
jgi:hypothetical protein